MPELISISTTLRNPERVPAFLKALAELEGQPFDSEHQIEYQVILIQHKEYKPNVLTQSEIDVFADPERSFTRDEARVIFTRQNYTGPDMRGRQSANPLNKLGLAIARGGMPVVITSQGRHLLDGTAPINEVFLRSFLKFQYPNPLSTAAEAAAFYTVPFVNTLRFIAAVNEIDDGGITKTEFGVFVTSLQRSTDIPKWLTYLSGYRKAKNKDAYIFDFAKHFYDEPAPTPEQINNFTEYGDNLMRYFRLTKYFSVTRSSFGAEWRMNIAPTRKNEVRLLLEKFDGQPKAFTTTEEYLEFLGDYDLPVLPFSTASALQDIAEGLRDEITAFVQGNGLNLSEDDTRLLSDVAGGGTTQGQIEQLRTLSLNLHERQQKVYLRHNVSVLTDASNTLRDTRALRSLKPEDLEKIATDTLKAINDEILIQGNYLKDDNGQPIGHASGGKADIECYYEGFNAICEVTLDNSTTQWIRESAPVMRHLKEFTDLHPGKVGFCIFIAPRIHNDTAHHYRVAITAGYDGHLQNIVPLSTEQFADLVDIVRAKLNSGGQVVHADLSDLFEAISGKARSVAGHTEWLASIPGLIASWGAELNHAN